jgi:hypothetical protein
METFDFSIRISMRGRRSVAPRKPRIERERRDRMNRFSTVTRHRAQLPRPRAVYAVSAAALGLSLAIPVRQAAAQDKKPADIAPPIVFQAAGPTADSIRSTIDAFRSALGDPNNGNNGGPLDNGRREINWDGGGVDTTTAPVTPFNVFLNTRGAQFTTLGTGLTQAPPSGGPQGGLAALFHNPNYGAIFSTFSTPRLFTPVGSNVTRGSFFVPGTNGAVAAAVTGFGAIFTDVDQPDGSGPGEKRGNRGASTLMEYFGADGELLYSSFVSASPGDGSLSFLGIMFNDALIARVRITSGNVAPGPDDDRKNDVVVMDDFIYGEPQPLP